jgi:hypothetical protein
MPDTEELELKIFNNNNSYNNNQNIRLRVETSDRCSLTNSFWLNLDLILEFENKYNMVPQIIDDLIK